MKKLILLIVILVVFLEDPVSGQDVKYQVYFSCELTWVTFPVLIPSAFTTAVGGQYDDWGIRIEKITKNAFLNIKPNTGIEVNYSFLPEENNRLQFFLGTYLRSYKPFLGIRMVGEGVYRFSMDVGLGGQTGFFIKGGIGFSWSKLKK